MWEQRNQIKHSSKSQYSQVLMQKNDEKITWYYKNQDTIDPGDRFLMNKDVEQVLKLNKKGKRTFLRRLERLEKIYREESKKPIKVHRKITTFFRLLYAEERK